MAGCSGCKLSTCSSCPEFTNVLLLSENHRFFAKITKNTVFGQTSSFFEFSNKLKKGLYNFWRGLESKTSLGFEIAQPQQKYQCRPTPQSLATMYISTYLPSSPAGRLPCLTVVSFQSPVVTTMTPLTRWRLVTLWLLAVAGSLDTLFNLPAAPCCQTSWHTQSVCARLAEGLNTGSSELRHCVWFPLRKDEHFFLRQLRSALRYLGDASGSLVL